MKKNKVEKKIKKIDKKLFKLSKKVKKFQKKKSKLVAKLNQVKKNPAFKIIKKDKVNGGENIKTTTSVVETKPPH